MADKQQYTPEQAFDLFGKMVKDPDPVYNKQREMYYGLKEKFPQGIPKAELFKQMEADPQFSEHFEIQGFGQPQPPQSNSGLRKAWDVATTPITKQVFGMSAAEAHKKITNPPSPNDSKLERFSRTMNEEFAGVVDSVQSPAAVATILLSGPLGGAIGKALPWIGKAARGIAAGYGAYKAEQGVSAMAEGTPEGYARGASDIVQGAAFMAPGAAKVISRVLPKGAAATTEAVVPEVWNARDAHAIKSYGKRYSELSTELKARIDNLAGMGTPPGPDARRALPGASSGRKVSDEATARMARSTASLGGPPPPGVPPPKQISTTKPAGLIEEGPSGYAPMPESIRVNRVEANRIAQKVGISPNTMIELLGHSNEDLVKAANDLRALKRQLIAHPSDMLPGTEEEGGYPVHKAERVSQLDKYISAIHELLLVSRRPPAPPQ